MSHDGFNVHPQAKAWQIRAWIPTDVEEVGYIACLAGQYNPGPLVQHNCGAIIDDNYNFVSTDSGLWLRRFVQFEGAVDCQGGDSGGAWYAGDEAWGIHYGSTVGNCTYSNISYALQYHGFDGLVTF